jgi:hypothetical protein
MLKLGKCIHFNGIQHGACGAGVAYDSIRDTSHRPFRLPCFANEGCATACAQYRDPTAAEVAADQAKWDAAMERMRRRAALGQCAQCGAAVDELEQVGPCVYANPCGCRQGQGDAKRMAQAMSLAS